MKLKKINTNLCRYWFLLMLLFSFFNGTKAYCQTIGQPHLKQTNLQTPASPMMEGIVSLHNYFLIIIFAIGLLVTALLIYVVFRYRATKNPIPSQRTHHTKLEIIWTITPLLIVMMIMVPSIRLMYRFEELPNPELTIKAIGKQWYWTYEYPSKDHPTIHFDSTLVEDKDLKPGQLRMFEVDKRVIVPIDTVVQVLITGADVLHSFAVPSLGIKKDAVPGRINETWFKIKKEGIYYGQCSELCGIKHGYMPIAIEAVSKEKFQAWKKDQLNALPKK